jgi:hypothetical protein
LDSYWGGGDFVPYDPDELEQEHVRASGHDRGPSFILSPIELRPLQQILGHQSAAFTLSVYGHIFDADLDLLAEDLERTVTSPGRVLSFREHQASRLRCLLVGET